MTRLHSCIVTVILLASVTMAYAQANWRGYGVTLKSGHPSVRPSPIPTPAPGAAFRANDFLNSLGAGTHDIQSLDTAAQIESALRYTGIRNIRDDATHNTSGAASVGDLCAIHSATGAMVDELPIVDSDPKNIADTQAEYEQLAACGAMLYAEGPNEPNNEPFYYQGKQCNSGSTFAPCAAYMQALYSMVHSDPKLAGMQVVGMTEVGAEPDNVGLQFLTVPAGSGSNSSSGTTFADIANCHNYVQGNGSAGTTLIDNHARYAETIARNGPDAGLWDAWGEYWGNTWSKGFAGPSTGQFDRPKVTTETGWNISNGSITAIQQGKLLTDLYLDAYQLGWSYTFVYLLLNDQYNNGFGMMNQDGSANPLGTYVHNLTTILADTNATFTPSGVTYSVSNLPPTAYSMLIEKGNGKHELVIWGEAFTSQTATRVKVNLGGTYPNVNIYDITIGSTPTQRLTNTNALSLMVSDHPVIVEF